MKHGSLFSGIGGFDLAAARCGVETAWQVEIDPFCRKVLEKNFPQAKRYEDIKAVKELEWVDIISGGFPCQDISHAGKKAGIEGERSGLWYEYARIIRLVRPRYVIVENVSALLVRGMGLVLGDLAQSGYDAEWQCIPACAIGAPHIRDRVWILAYPQRMGRTEGKSKPRKLLGKGPPMYSKRLGQARNWRKIAVRLCRGNYGLSNQVDKLRALGNAIVPQVAEWIFRRILEAERGSGEHGAI